MLLVSCGNKELPSAVSGPMLLLLSLLLAWGFVVVVVACGYIDVLIVVVGVVLQ